MASKREVRIINPGGGSGFTSAKQAIKYLKRGRARFRPDLGENVIEFIEADHRHLAVVKSIEREGAASTRPHSVNLEIVPEYKGTNDYATFGRYPMFPSTAFKRNYKKAA